MRVRGATGIAAAMLVLVAGTATATNQTNGLTGAAGVKFAELELEFPGARVLTEGTNIKMVYGVPMSGGATPDAAAEAWLASYASVWGISPSDLEIDRAHEISNGRFTVFAYKQTMNGLPVEGGIARIVVNNALGKVVLASSKLADRPADGFAALAMDAEQAVQIAAAHPMFRSYGNWTIPELVVWADAEGRRTTEAWKFEGGHDLPGDFQWRTFFVDTATGVILEARDEVYTIDVSGNVQGFGTPNLLAHSAGNPPANLPMPKIRMTITGGNNAFTNSSGNYTIANPGSSAVTVTSNLSAGQWVNVNPNGIAELSVSGSVTPPGPGNFIFGDGSTLEGNVAQINAFVHTTLTHDYIKDRAPAFTGLDIVIPANTGVSGTCNAFFTTGGGGPSINFYNSGGGCNNTSFSTVVAHEYGHFIVNRLGLSQNAFGEGFGDTMAIMMYDTGVVGQGFFTGGGAIRNPASANQQYPCSSSAIHTCGQILGGTWYELTENYQSFYGTATGLDLARQLNVDWAMITVGGSGTLNSAHPATAIEVLTVDDDNGNLSDGTPNYSRICNAFGQHGISCPSLQLLAFTYPSGRPEYVTPGVAATFPVIVSAVGSTPIAGTGAVVYSINGGSQTLLPMTQNSPNNYTASLPIVACGDKIEYYIRAQSAAGFAFDPSTATSDGARFVATGAYGVEIPFEDDMEINRGWTVGAPGDNATSGIWNRMDPQGTAAQPEDDTTPAPGVNCWVTDGRAGSSIGEFDVDNGTTTLVSPVINLDGASGAKISYWRWYSNDKGAAPNADIFVIQISNNNGSTWTTVETVGPTGPQASGGWYFHEFNVGDFVAPTSTVRMRFQASDLGSGSIVEAAVDDFKVTVVDCTPPCAADINGGGLDVTDLLDFLDAFGTCENQPAPCSSGGISGDFNGDTFVDILDFLDYLDAFGTGCD
ncbi:MAG: hypothetical protein KF838_08410 [Phycisphaeraceae bacterium]|nr:MAG: hypothetical protein KF838_08410 [Phycisphaeraceae bacterium]